MSISIRRRLGVAVTVLAASAAVASSAQAGTAIAGKYCSGVPGSGSSNICLSPSVNLPNGWHLYARAEMQGYHGAGSRFTVSFNAWGTSNYVYSHCWVTGQDEGNPHAARGYNVSGATRNMEVLLFHASAGDCPR